MKSIVKTGVGLALSAVMLASSGSIYAKEAGRKTVASVGNDSGANYFKVEGGWGDNECRYNVVYFPDNTDAGKSWLSILLSANASGRELSRVVYNRNDSTTRCDLILVETD